MGPWGAVAGAVGGWAGHRPKPPRNPADLSLFEDQWVHDPEGGGGAPKYDKDGKQIAYKNGEDRGTQREYFGKLLGEIDEGISGKGFLDEQAYNDILGPGRGNIAAMASAQRKRVSERALMNGSAPGSGTEEESMTDVDLGELAAMRGLYAGLAGQDAMQRSSRNIAMTQMLNNLLQGERDFQKSERDDQYRAKLARSQSSSMLQDILGGAAAGFLGMPSMGGGGGGGAAQGAMPSPYMTGTSGTGGDYPYDGAGFNLDGEWWGDGQMASGIPSMSQAAPVSQTYGGIGYIDPATGRMIGG